MHAKVFNVDVAAEAGVEEQIPARMMVVVVDVDLIAVPLPIAAAVDIVRSDDSIPHMLITARSLRMGFSPIAKLAESCFLDGLTTGRSLLRRTSDLPSLMFNTVPR